MTILQHLQSKYGKEQVNSILESLNHDDKNYKSLIQYITLSEEVIDDNLSYYKSATMQELAVKIKNKYMLYELSNILSQIDFTFKRYNTCITYGTFDLFHIGHLNLLKRIKAMCTNLIVAVSTDEFNTLKGKHCVIPYEQRAAIVASSKYVTKVIPEETWDQKKNDITQYNVDCFIMGDDWTGKFDYLTEYCDVLYIPRTPDISTTELKGKLSNLSSR